MTILRGKPIGQYFPSGCAAESAQTALVSPLAAVSWIDGIVESFLAQPAACRITDPDIVACNVTPKLNFQAMLDFTTVNTVIKGRPAHV